MTREELQTIIEEEDSLYMPVLGMDNNFYEYVTVLEVYPVSYDDDMVIVKDSWKSKYTDAVDISELFYTEDEAREWGIRNLL